MHLSPTPKLGYLSFKVRVCFTTTVSALIHGCWPLIHSESHHIHIFKFGDFTQVGLVWFSFKFFKMKRTFVQKNTMMT